jgi:hypothetical protein
MGKFQRVLVGILISWTGVDAACADIVVNAAPAPSRGVAVAASTPTGPAGAGETFGGTGLYTKDVGVVGSGVGGTMALSADADHSSLTPTPTGPALTGTGTGAVEAIGGIMGDSYSLTAQSFFDVFFTVDAAATYLFDATAQWDSTFPPPNLGGFSFVDLRDVTGGLPGISLVGGGAAKGVGDTGTEHLAASVGLSPGTTYRLEARLLLSGGGGAPALFSATATWTFSLSIVPEVGSAAMMTLATLGAALCAWRTPRHKA